MVIWGVYVLALVLTVDWTHVERDVTYRPLTAAEEAAQTGRSGLRRRRMPEYRDVRVIRPYLDTGNTLVFLLVGGAMLVWRLNDDPR